MDNVLDIQIIHKVFVNINKDGLESDCSIPYNHTCASNSLCIGISANNRSICICRMNKFGSRCLSTDRIC